MVLLCYLTAILARDARRLESRSLLQSLPNSKYSRPIFMCTILLKNAFSHSLNILSNDAIVVHLTFARMPPPIRQIRYSFTYVFFILYMIRGPCIIILVLFLKAWTYSSICLFRTKRHQKLHSDHQNVW